MKYRMLVALCSALTLAAATFAQQPEEVPTPPTPAALEPADPAPVVDSPGWGTNAATPGQFWATGDFVFGWFNGDRIPILVTTSPVGTARAAAGVLGQQTTSVLFGNDTVNDSARAGVRFEAGYWFDPERTLGIQAGFFYLSGQDEHFAASSDGTTILARPFFDATTNRQNSTLIAFPGSSSGSIDVQDKSSNFYETHLEFTENVFDSGSVRLDSLLGYRFYRYSDALGIQQTRNLQGGNFVAGTQLVTIDDFRAQNTFNGGDFGLRTQFVRGNLSVALLTKVSVGGVDREVNISGTQTTTVPGTAPVTQFGGVYALSSNIGSHYSFDWAVMPEFGLSASWQATSNLRVNVGYSLFMLNRIARAADQIDLTLNPNLFPPVLVPPVGPNRPAVIPTRSDLWGQNLNLGVEISY